MKPMRDIRRFAAALTVVFAVVTPAMAAEARETVRLAKHRPVTVVGTGFAAHERVTVRVAPRGGAPYAKTVRATAAGRLTAVFAARALDDCAAYTITAVGSGGSRARRIEIPPPCGIVVQP